MKWQDQYLRVHRWYDKLLQFDHSLDKYDRNRDEYQDLLWAFFQSCWHLKDWIKNDENLKKNRPEIGKRITSLIDKEHATNIECLFVCSDLANRSKHATIDSTRGPRRNAQALNTVSEMHVSHGFSFGSNPEHSVVEIEDTWDCLVTYDDGVGGTIKIDAIGLAKACLNEWDQVIRDELKLPLPSRPTE